MSNRGTWSYRSRKPRGGIYDSCLRKAAYPSYEIAMSVRRQLKKMELRVYLCDVCGKHHLTSRPERKAAP